MDKYFANVINLNAKKHFALRTKKYQVSITSLTFSYFY